MRANGDSVRSRDTSK